MKKITSLLLLLPFFVLSQVQIGQDIEGPNTYINNGTISLSSDGNIVAIGDAYEGAKGSVRLYINQEGTWMQLGQTIYGEGTSDFSGYCVSLSSNGNIVAIGAIYDDGNGFDSGNVRIYVNQNDLWQQIGEEIGGEFGGDNSGFSISLSEDGNIVAIGAEKNNGNGSYSGHVRIYTNQNGNWLQLGQDIDGEFPGDNSGVVSLSADGNVVAIGAPNNHGNGTYSGHVRVYANQNGYWQQIGEDINGEDSANYSGRYISLSADGNIVAIGAPNNNDNGALSGHVRVFSNENDTWVQIGEDINGEFPYDRSSVVSMSADGNIIAIGAPNHNGNNTFSGYIRVFANQNGSWVQIGEDIEGESTQDNFGRSISLSRDGRVVSAVINNNSTGPTFSKARIYDLSALLSSDEFILSQFGLYPNPAKTKFTIQLNEGTQLEKVNIYNSLGQFTNSIEVKTVDTSQLAAGLYYVEIITNKGKATKKLIIE